MALVTLAFADGTTIAFDSPSDAASLGSFSLPDPEARLVELASGLHKVSESLRSRLTPDEISIEAGVSFSAEAGVFFAKTALEGNLTVSLTSVCATTRSPTRSTSSRSTKASRRSATSATPRWTSWR